MYCALCVVVRRLISAGGYCDSTLAACCLGDASEVWCAPQEFSSALSVCWWCFGAFTYCLFFNGRGLQYYNSGVEMFCTCHRFLFLFFGTDPAVQCRLVLIGRNRFRLPCLRCFIRAWTDRQTRCIRDPTYSPVACMLYYRGSVAVFEVSNCFVACNI